MNVNEVLANWDIPFSNSKQIYNSAWAIGEDYILKTGTDIEAVSRNITLMKKLNENNIPVARVIPTRGKQDFMVIHGEYFLLTERVRGHHIEFIFEQDYQTIGYECGKTIARVHKAFLDIQNEVICWDNTLCREMDGWIQAYFSSHDNSIVTINEFQEVQAKLREVDTVLPKQLVHRDLHLQNLLFQDGIVSGYIDFDLSQINYRIFDLCYFELSLLMDVYQDEGNTQKWLAVSKAIYNGYESIITITEEEKNAVPIIMKSIELLFVAYFGQNKQDEFANGAYQMYQWICKHEKELKKILI